MLLSHRQNGLTSLFKEASVFKAFEDLAILKTICFDTLWALLTLGVRPIQLLFCSAHVSASGNAEMLAMEDSTGTVRLTKLESTRFDLARESFFNSCKDTPELFTISQNV